MRKKKLMHKIIRLKDLTLEFTFTAIISLACLCFCVLFLHAAFYTSDPVGADDSAISRPFATNDLEFVPIQKQYNNKRHPHVTSKKPEYSSAFSENIDNSFISANRVRLHQHLRTVSKKEKS